MAEILLRVHDKVNDDLYLDCKCTKRGDVIVVSPDGWNWGTEERSLPFYRIVKMPGVSVAAAQAFLGRELDTDPTNPSRTLQRRAFRFNIEHASLPTAFASYLADDTRASATFTLAAFKDHHLAAVKSGKSRIADPGVIG